MVTAQYFTWYICLLPLIAHRLTRSRTLITVMGVVWVTAAGLWLSQAYLLEFEGSNAFLQVWVSALLFHAANVLCISAVVILAR